MITMNDIRWGSYKEFEGPWTLGELKYSLPEDPTDEDRIMAVMTATEGGRYDMVNMYDVCLWTAGVIQWCNRAPQHSVDGMMGLLYQESHDLLKPLTDLAAERGYYFRVVDGKPRFLDSGHSLVKTPEAQQKLYFRESTGAKDAWKNDADKDWAKRWCLATARVWQSARARELQVKYTAPKVIKWFAFGAGKTVLEQMPDTPVGHAWRAMYLSFAGNNPRKAAEAVEASLNETKGYMEAWSEPWLANMANHMTFGPGISIYPHRYDKIRPVIEKMFGVDLPDTAARTAEWAGKKGISERWLDPFELQSALLSLGADLGPRGADGVIGEKTRAALLAIERAAKIPVEFQDGMPDKYTLGILDERLREVRVDIGDGSGNVA